MLSYLIRRILIFIPTLIIISLVGFTISLNAPGDPVERMITSGSSEGGQNADKSATEKEYLQIREKLGLHLPVFYLALSSLSEPDTLYRITKPNHKKALKRLIAEYGNWKEIAAYYQSLRYIEKYLYLIPVDSMNYNSLLKAKLEIFRIQEEYKEEDIIAKTDTLKSLFSSPEGKHIFRQISSIENSFNKIITERTPYKNYLPVVHFYGTQNQYHRWLMGLVRWDFGMSYLDKRPITTKINEAIVLTLAINLIAIFISYIVAIPLGIQAAVKQYSAFDRASSAVLFILYSLPGFWIATMLIMFLGGGDYLAWFPNNGYQDTMHSSDWSFLQRLGDWSYHLILPVFCITYASFAYISRQMRVGMLEVIRQDYIRTARAKGLTENKVIYKHAFRNSLLPIITLFAHILPAAVSGSVIIEVIFTIPGMGQVSFNATTARDYPMIIAVFTMSGFLTLLGILLADILYTVVDPRITFSKKR